MNSIQFNQDKPTKVVLLGVLFLLIPFVTETVIPQFVFLLSSGFLMLGYRVSYQISKYFINQRIISFFGILLFKMKLNLQFPEYISLFGAQFSNGNDWGSIAALGTNSKSDKIVIRLFNGNENFTLYKSNNYEKTKVMANNLSSLLNIELIDKGNYSKI